MIYAYKIESRGFWYMTFFDTSLIIFIFNEMFDNKIKFLPPILFINLMHLLKYLFYLLERYSTIIFTFLVSKTNDTSLTPPYKKTFHRRL